MPRRAAKTIALLAALLLLGACGTLPREVFDPSGPRPATPQALLDVRFTARDAAAAISNAQPVMSRLQAERGGFNVLALSGGGANGAYGAGVLAGWSKTGKRPKFDIVTGVSTGALAAPFAFLGPDWDDRMKAAYTSGDADDLIGLRALNAFGGPSLFSAVPIRRLVEHYVDAGLLRAVAAEHAKGRRLLVATTNLDTQETTIWDMGAIATRADPGAVKLFQDVLVASSSIPGVFPPVMIGLDGAAGSFSEMHADGGVMTPFFTVPESMLLWTDPDGAIHKGAIFVLINGQVGATFGVTRGNLLGILSRSYDAMSKASTRTLLAATAAFAERNGLTLQVSEIPDAAEAQGLNFKAANMRRLFEMGYDRAVAGEAWHAPLTASE
ncbi:MAG: patatin-like phospholipase family protein [Caulobacter sp.]|nr:patatin-like phospholipase family protein [Caulobacter sp.]